MAASPQSAEKVLDALGRRGKTVVEVHGRSMYPTLRNGVKVVVCTVAYDELLPGDLVVFHNGQEVVCHRLIKKCGQNRRSVSGIGGTCRTCVCKGDTNLFADPPTEWKDVIGRVTGVLDAKQRLHPIDTEQHRSRFAMLARLTYPYAFYLNLMHVMGRCRWWQR